MKIPDLYRKRLTENVLTHYYAQVHILNPGTIEDTLIEQGVKPEEKKVLRGSLLRRGFAEYEHLPSDAGDTFSELYIMNSPDNVWLLMLLCANRYDFRQQSDNKEQEYRHGTA